MQQLFYILPITYILLLNFAGLFAFLRRGKLCLNFSLIITALYITFFSSLATLLKHQNSDTKPDLGLILNKVATDMFDFAGKLTFLFCIVGFISFLVYTFWKFKKAELSILNDKSKSMFSNIEFILKNYGIYLVGLVLCLGSYSISTALNSFVLSFL